MSLLSRSEIIKQNNSQFSEGWVSLPNIDLVDQVSNSLDSGLALNAMPTPFARAEVVREAFEAIILWLNNASGKLLAIPPLNFKSLNDPLSRTPVVQFVLLSVKANFKLSNFAAVGT